MARGYRFLVLAGSLGITSPALACEPVLPFIQVMAPAIALSGSILVLVVAVVVKSALFAIFERRLPRIQAAWRMFIGNVVTSCVGWIVAGMIGNGIFWVLGVPLVCFVCWLASRRLVEVAPLSWLARTSRKAIAAIMTGAFLASCILFMAGQDAVSSHQLTHYWTIKLIAIFLALFASVTLTTVIEEWVIWELSFRPEKEGFFGSVLRTNLYVLVLVMAVPAILILPKRLKSHDFLAQRQHKAIVQTSATSH